MGVLAVALVFLLAGNTARAAGQPSAASGPTGRVTKPSPLSAEALPISIERIRKKLAQAPPSEVQKGLRLEYYIEVYGKAPSLDLFTDFNLKSGPVPFGAPTHKDFLDEMTPQEFRAPAADLSALMAWLSQQLGKRRAR